MRVKQVGEESSVREEEELVSNELSWGALRDREDFGEIPSFLPVSNRLLEDTALPGMDTSKRNLWRQLL